MILGLFFLGITGATLNGNTLYTWGDRLLAWTLPKLKSQMLAAPAHPAASGCLDDQGTGLFLQEGDQLVYRKGPAWKARPIDHGIDMHDCLSATLLGHRGVLVVQRGMQLRFYEYPDFQYLEIYSFYSRSRQGDFLLTDIDCDAFLDIVSRKSWIHNPVDFCL